MQQRQRPESEDEIEEEEEPIQVGGQTGEQMQLEFLFMDPLAEHFQSLKILLNQYLDGVSFRSSELSDAIIQQVQIGTMIGVEDSSDIYGFATIMNLSTKLQVIEEIIHFITVKSQTHNKKHNEFMHLLAAPSKMGLLINERLLNLAPQLIPLLHNQLFEDVKWTQNEDPNDEISKVQNLIIMTKAVKDPKKHVAKKTNELQSLIYQKFEDYILLQKAQQYFIFDYQQKNTGEVSNQMQYDQAQQQFYRIVYIISLKDYLESLAEIGNQVN